MISKEFMTAGQAVFTVSNPRGERYTFRVSKMGPFYETPGSFLAQILTGPDNTASYTPLLVMEPPKQPQPGDGDGFPIVKRHWRSPVYLDEKSKPFKVFLWVLKLLHRRRDPPAGYEVRHAGKCGRCGRKLTVPESIDSGLGPECSKRR